MNDINAADSPFQVIVLGVGDAFSARYSPTSLLLRAEGDTLAIDCPDMYRAVLRRASRAGDLSLDVADVDRVLITHLHGDHVGGLEGLAFYKRFVENKRLALYCPPEVRRDIWTRRLAVAMDTLYDGERYREMSFEDYFDCTVLDWDAEHTVGAFTLALRRTVHHIPTAALFVRAAGRALGYSCDTAFDRELVDWLARADLVIHETNFGAAHTPYEKLAALPAELRERMRLVHYSDLFDLDASVIEPAREGDCLTV
ncbi:MAG: ribonuclease Z [Myxococcales bacterium]|nr:ribonuclease Z [Myxococcales bacterium]